MKVTEIHFDKEDISIQFYIGQNASDNFFVLDNSKPTDIWFHLKDISSCHVVASIPEDIKIDKKTMKKIINTGALLCKQNTLKAKSMYNIPVMYTFVEHVAKTKVPGSVIAENIKFVIC
jgi:predicted ribosome quality control (RQC) complex YloA/Tae2 family protein